MHILDLADTLASWAKTNGILSRQEVTRRVPSASALESVARLHPQLVELYQHSNGIDVLWERGEVFGRLCIPSASELVKAAKSQRRFRDEYSDEDVVDAIDDPRWRKLLPTFRNLVDFHSEGNGDSIGVSSLDGNVYFLAHDWMDWVSDDLPLFKLAKSVMDFYQGWAKVNFADPKHMWWMATVVNGKFGGFKPEHFPM